MEDITSGVHGDGVSGAVELSEQVEDTLRLAAARACEADVDVRHSCETGHGHLDDQKIGNRPSELVKRTWGTCKSRGPALPAPCDSRSDEGRTRREWTLERSGRARRALRPDSTSGYSGAMRPCLLLLPSSILALACSDASTSDQEGQSSGSPPVEGFESTSEEPVLPPVRIAAEEPVVTRRSDPSPPNRSASPSVRRASSRTGRCESSSRRGRTGRSASWPIESCSRRTARAPSMAVGAPSRRTRARPGCSTSTRPTSSTATTVAAGC